jgi:hypothetical protein
MPAILDLASFEVIAKLTSPTDAGSDLSDVTEELQRSSMYERLAFLLMKHALTMSSGVTGIRIRSRTMYASSSSSL